LILSRPVTDAHDKTVTAPQGNIPVSLTTAMLILNVGATYIDIDDMHDEIAIQPKAIISVSWKMMSSD
jgi:hypothetical protein